jgi:hypothetical protein
MDTKPLILNWIHSIPSLYIYSFILLKFLDVLSCKIYIESCTCNFISGGHVISLSFPKLTQAYSTICWAFRKSKDISCIAIVAVDILKKICFSAKGLLVRTWVRITHQHLACITRWLNGVGLRMRPVNRYPVSQQVWRDKHPSLPKGPEPQI